MGFLDRLSRRRSRRPDPQLMYALQEFFSAPTWEQGRRVIQRHPELLREEADAVLQTLAQDQKEPQVRQRLEGYRALLCRFRELGIDAVFEEIASVMGGQEGQALGEDPTIPLAVQAEVRRADEAGERYLQSSDASALDEAIAASERILCHPGLTRLDLTLRLAMSSDAGALYLRRYQASGHVEDLDRALELFHQAVELTPPDSPQLPMYLCNLGGGLSDRYARTGDLPDLEKAIRNYEQAVELTPTDSPNLPTILNNLGNGLDDRYARTGELPDLEKAIHNYERAVELTPPGSPDLPRHLSNLGIGLRDRYRRTGDLPDLEKAIHNYQQAVELTPPGSPHLPGRLGNLAMGLRERYDRTGELPDLEKAIHYCEQAIKLTPPGSLYRSGLLTTLATGLTDGYRHTGELPDLEKAIHHWEQAIELTPPGSLDLPGNLSNLGVGLRERYARTGDLPDLEKAIHNFGQAVELTPPGSLYRPGRLSGLGLGLRDRYAHMGELPDLEKAIHYCEQAVELIPPGSPDLPMCLDNLAIVLSDRYGCAGELPDLERAIDAWEQAWLLLQTTFVAAPVAYKLGQQRQWSALFANLVATHLQHVQVTPSQAPAHRRRAIEVAEGSKSRLLTELLGRGDMPAPPDIPGKMVEREKELLEALTSLDTTELSSHGLADAAGKEPCSLESLEQRGHYLQELNGLWEEMAQYGPEAEDYVALRRGDPPDWDHLSNLAADLGTDTALLSFFNTTDRTLLFILRKGWEEPAVVETDVDGRAWNDIARRFQREIHEYDSTERRGETWDQFLRSLMEEASRHLDGAKRVIFAPEAFGHLIPWSVVAWRAGLQGSDGLPLPLVTLPALGVLSRLRQRPAGRKSGALVVGNPLGDLRYAEVEAEEVAELLGAQPLIGPRATKEAVLQCLSGASVVHLSTHAHFDQDSPLDSGIILADGILTAREVMSHRLQADLLVLSACQTGMAGALGGDEMAGLAQAFLQAGARSLVVSLWSVNDPATAALMSAFYATRQTGADKAMALSRAMGEVRAEERWSHPYYWGAFVLMGDWN